MDFWQTQIMKDLGQHIGALFTIFLLSFLYKENRFFRLSEQILVGFGAGFQLLVAYKSVKSSLWDSLIAGNFMNIIPLILCILLLTRYSSKYAYLMRYPTALILGVGTAIGLRGKVHAVLIQQTQGIISLAFPAENIMTATNNYITIIATLTTLIVFFFTFRRFPVYNNMAKIGRIFIMVAMGGVLASDIFGQFSILIARIQYLLIDWLRLRVI